MKRKFFTTRAKHKLTTNSWAVFLLLFLFSCGKKEQVKPEPEVAPSPPDAKETVPEDATPSSWIKYSYAKGKISKKEVPASKKKSDDMVEYRDGWISEKDGKSAQKLDKGYVFYKGKLTSPKKYRKIMSKKAKSKLKGKDLKTISGDTYKNVQIQKITPGGIDILHSTGGKHLEFSDLPEKIRKMFGYNESSAKKYRQKLADAEARKEKKERKREEKLASKKEEEKKKPKTFKYKGKWLTDYQQALKFSKEFNRPVLVLFTGSDWCGYCVKLKREILDNNKFINFAKANLILMEADFPRSKTLPAKTKAQNNSLSKQYGVQGFPTMFLIDSNEKQLGRFGYNGPGVDKYIDEMRKYTK